MTNFEHLRGELRTFEGMNEIFSKICGKDGCVLDGLTESELECPSDCTCRECIGTWLSSEWRGIE